MGNPSMELLTRLKKSVRHRASYKISEPLSKLLSVTGFGQYGPGPKLTDPEPVRRANIPVEDARFELEDVRRFWEDLSSRSERIRQCCQQQPIWEKVPQYYFTWKQLQHLLSREESVFVDIASTQDSPYFELLRLLARARHRYRQDLIFEPGVHGDRIGGSAAALPLEDRSVDAMTLHCSFEHFEGEADTGFIREVGRVLRPGGRVCIVPLYLGQYAFTMCDPAWGYDIRPDAGSRVHLFPRWGERHGRFYSADTLRERVFSPALAAGLSPKVVHFSNVLELSPSCYTHFGLILDKPA
ncbi:class I SAM-dependent methyltransferase [Hyalangium rubrum]|uniref:Class I SAM-dependent methyltransferase n=1 Tax=Hyalangium rubrum TaxID=3103134 RepID=A0ABU5HIV9_9BACT|nr:class I SAM-dependent methyltransferase [Hyalangium sp. s54d21]MDY7232814.1 class I SAM-dependent methyltransferase [Hyalangium sp. s54d21]